MSSWMLVFASVLLQTCLIYGKYTNSTTAPTLDNSKSIDPKISEMDKKFAEILDIVNATRNSPIKNFIVVTKNDLTIDLLIMYNDWQNLEKYSADIASETEGYSNCSNLLKDAILMALNTILEDSTLYIFMDDPLCFISEHKGIKKLTTMKHVQMIFITSGICEYEVGTDFQSNHNVGYNTIGTVLPISKSKVIKSLDYVMEGIINKQYLLAYEKFSDVSSYKLEFTVDNPIDDVLILIATQNMDSIVTKTIGPDGSDTDTSLYFLGKSFMIVRLMQLQTGVYKTEICSESETYIKVMGKSNINFQCGFSTFLASSLIETARRPAADGNIFLSIQICTEGINLTTAKIEDMNGITLEELRLRTPGEDHKFFSSKSFDPPRTTFRIAVEGYEVKTKAPFWRESAILFKRQNPKTEKRKEVAPKITIEKWPKIITKYNVSYRLKCKAQGYPSPYISWHNKDSGNLLPAKVFPIEEPYEYISILDIGEPYKNTTYECRASNSAGNAIKDIQVEVFKYLRIVQAPKGIMKVKYDNKVTIYCEIDAYPPVTILWYKDNNILTGDSNTVISNDNSSVTIKQMTFETKGRYKCEVSNELDTKNFNSHLILIDVGSPKIYSMQRILHVLIGNDAELVCRIIKEVIPKATIYWSYPQISGEVYEEKTAISNILHLKNVTDKHTGIYVCIASNYLGNDYYSMELIVDYAPISTKELRPIKVKVGTVVKIPCNVKGVPSPKIEWFYNNKRIKTTSTIHITTKNSLIIKSIKEYDEGNYTCIAYNKYGSLKKTLNVEVFDLVYIKTPAATKLNVKVNDSFILKCEANGYPEPEIQWIYDDFHGKYRMQNLRYDKESKNIKIINITLEDEGYYSCIARNKYDSKQLTYEIRVNDERNNKD